MVYGDEVAKVLQCIMRVGIEICGCEEFMCGLGDKADCIEDVFCEGWVGCLEG